MKYSKTDDFARLFNISYLLPNNYTVDNLFRIYYVKSYAGII